MRMFVRSVALFLLVSSAVAHADPPGLSPVVDVSPPAEDIPSYRLQTALADASALGIGMLASKSNAPDNQASSVAVATYALGAPLVHLYHHHPQRAAASLALRVGLPLLGAVIGGGIGRSNCSEYCDNDADIAGAALGIVSGAVLASTIDIGYLSRGEQVTRSAPALAPSFGAGPGGAVRIGIGGSF